MTTIIGRQIQLREQYKKQGQGYQPVPKTRPGKLGKGDAAETLEVPGQTGYVYVRLTELGDAYVVALNLRVANVYDLPVLVGYDIYDPSTLQVLSADSKAISIANGGQIVYNPNITPHHETHEWMNPDGGNDVVYVQLRQFMPLRPSVNNGLNVNIARGWVYTEVGWKEFEDETVDLTASVPPTGARLSLVYVETDGTIQVRDGEIVLDEILLAETDIPVPELGELAICAVKLVAGQTEIVEGTDYTDLIDLRFPFQAGNGVGGGGSVSNSDLALVEAEMDFAITTIAVDYQP